MSLSFIIILVACLPARVSYKRPSHRSPSREHQYVVQRGDSLWRISQRYGISVEEIMMRNNISHPQELDLGETLIIPTYERKDIPLSLQWPVEGTIILSFGEKMNNVTSNGLHIRCVHDQIVKAAAEGEVVFSDTLKGWRQTVILKHPSDLYTVYADLDTSSVHKGNYVQQGESIASLKGCSSTDGCVVYFEIRKKHLAQNPLRYLPH